MKMKPEHYEHLRAECNKVIASNSNMEKEYRLAGLSSMRYRWDICYKANLIPYICSNLYNYLNDDHIDTALRHICRAK